MELRFTKHALERLFEREISPDECREVFDQNNIIEIYPDDTPYPSELRLGHVKSGPIHLVCALDQEVVHIITVYRPDPNQWEDNFKKRKRK